MRSFKIYDFTLSAGGAMPLLVEGGYFKIYSCTGVLSVSIDGGSSIGPINTGQGMKTEFKRLTIVDQSGAANVGKIIVASDEFVDGRISGEVSVIDGGKSRTLANLAFNGTSGVAAVIAQLGHIQLWNPSSTKNLVVEQLQASSSAINVFTVRAHNAALATLIGNAASKKIGGADSIAEMRTASAVAPIPTGKGFAGINTGANNAYIYQLREPVIVPPSQSIVIYNGVLNTDMTANFEFYEDPI